MVRAIGRKGAMIHRRTSIGWLVGLASAGLGFLLVIGVILFMIFTLIRGRSGITYGRHNMAGNSYYESRIYKRAAAEYTAMIELDPNRPDGYLLRAMAEYRMGAFDKAIADNTKAIQLEHRPGGSAAIYYNRGLDYNGKADIDRAAANLTGVKADREHAIADFTQSLDLGDKGTDAYHNRGF